MQTQQHQKFPYAESQLLPELPADLRDICFDIHNPWRRVFNHVVTVIKLIGGFRPGGCIWDDNRELAHAKKMRGEPMVRNYLLCQIGYRNGASDSFCDLLGRSCPCCDYTYCFACNIQYNGGDPNDPDNDDCHTCDDYSTILPKKELDLELRKLLYLL